MWRPLARLRVPLGFAFAALAFWLAEPTVSSAGRGLLVALIGQALRIWAAGHIEKGREVTRSGPYGYVRHPLYLGSTIMGVGFMIAARSWIVAALVGTYLLFTLVAAMRTEEATLDERFAGEYSAYRRGAAPPVSRRFSFARAMANKEYRAVAGLAIGMAILFWRAGA
jgi:protein-S-isoprenylcysteine O-methyltransferase Ste14